MTLTPVSFSTQPFSPAPKPTFGSLTIVTDTKNIFYLNALKQGLENGCTLNHMTIQPDTFKTLWMDAPNNDKIALHLVGLPAREVKLLNLLRATIVDRMPLSLRRRSKIINGAHLSLDAVSQQLSVYFSNNDHAGRALGQPLAALRQAFNTALKPTLELN